MAGYKYEDLKEGYNNFENPVAVVKINGKDFADNKGSLVLNDLEVELTCGFEASIASFCLYNTFNRTTSVYRFDEFKQYVQLGAKTEIAFGYLGQARIVFAGVITGVSFRMDLGGIPYVMVTAMDVKGLMMSSSFAKQLQAKSYSDAVKEIFKRVAYSKLKQEDLLKLEIDETPDANEEKDNKSRTIEMVNESDYEFVVKAAKRYNYEFFADSTAIYFRKAKKNKETLITLGPTRGILYFDIGYDITGLVEELEARGMDPGKGTLLTAKKKISNKISTGKYAKALLGGSAKVCIDPAITSKQEAQYRVDSMAEQMTYQFGSLECTCLGIPELVPGRFVEIEKLGEPADNVFYIQTVRHVFDKYNGYRTTLIGQTGGLNFSPDR